MKRLIAAGIIFVFVVLISFFGGRLVFKTEKEVTLKISEIIKEQNNRNIYEFKEYWDKQSIALSFFVNRENIDEIGKNAAKMAAAAQNNDKEEILSAAEEIKYIIGYITKQEKLQLLSFS